MGPSGSLQRYIWRDMFGAGDNGMAAELHCVCH